MEMKDELANLLAANQHATLLGLTLLLRAVAKQPGIDKDKLIADLLQLLPQEGQEPLHPFLTTWREVIQTNFWRPPGTSPRPCG